MAHTLEAQQQPPTTASRYSSVPSHTDRVSPPQYHNNNKSSSVSVVEWPLCFWAAQTVAAKMEYDLGYQKPDDDESSPPPEANTQDLGEGVEADDICDNASVESQHIPPTRPIQVGRSRFAKYLEESEKELAEIRLRKRNRFDIC